MHDEAAFDPATLRYYQETAATYAGSGAGGQNRFLADFMATLRPGARVLDLGCGGGRDAAAMLDRGFDVDAVEGAPSIARLAAARIGRAVRVMRFDQLAAVSSYDAVWASASLIHVPRAALPGILARIFAALKPGGRHFATYKAGGVAARDSAGRYYNYPSADELRAFYTAAAAWDDIGIHDYVGGGFESGSGPWLAIAARRPAVL